MSLTCKLLEVVHKYMPEKMISDDGLDAIILTSRDHTRYFCGFQIIIWISNLSKPGALIITRGGETA